MSVWLEFVQKPSNSSHSGWLQSKRRSFPSKGPDSSSKSQSSSSEHIRHKLPRSTKTNASSTVASSCLHDSLSMLPSSMFQSPETNSLSPFEGLKPNCQTPWFSTMKGITPSELALYLFGLTIISWNSNKLRGQSGWFNTAFTRWLLSCHNCPNRFARYSMLVGSPSVGIEGLGG